MTLTQIAERAARRVREKLEERCRERLREVRVFGSMARGEAHAESDLDLLVLVDTDEPSLRDLVVFATTDVEAELGYPFAISPCIMSVGRFQELLDRELLFATDVQAEGIPV